ncbi:MAG: glycosyl hydrolase [Planctomycetes bacterium]|nr:glycosyl hydrolase [Planctomycetota bacterium]
MIRQLIVVVTMLATNPAGGSSDLVTVVEDIISTGITASSEFSPAQTVHNVINGSGLSGERHDSHASAETMWHTLENPTATSPATGIPPYPAWIRFDFAEPNGLDEINIWNHNQAGLTDRGFRQTVIYGSADGSSWRRLVSVDLAQGGSDAHSVAISSDTPLRAVILAAESNYGSAYYGLSEVKFIRHRKVPPDEVPFPTGMTCRPTRFYRHRPDGHAGREIIVRFNGVRLYGQGELDIAVAGYRPETVEFSAGPRGAAEMSVLLPPDASVDRDTRVSIGVRSGKRGIHDALMVPAQRQWKIYVIPHSHVDIGYTNTQENCEFIHTRNILEAIKLAKETAHFPPESRFLWDTEVSWPAERLLANGTVEEKQAMLDAIRKGIIHVGASYVNDNTSVTADEEFAALFGPTKEIEKLTGRQFKTMMQVDVPGMSWGTVQAAARHGIPYVFLFNNGSTRVGLSMELSFRPFWWIGPDGQSKVLCIQAGSYEPCALIKGKHVWPSMMGQTDRSKLPAVVRTENPRENFIDAYLWGAGLPRYNNVLETLERDPLYPYDILPMSWALADNTPVDADLPYAARSWNEEYAYPKVILASSTDIMTAFHERYGDIIPVRKGEFTEYWSDGLGSAARETATNRNSKERLIQTETLWSMLHAGRPAPRADIHEAWRNILLGSEHTWCFADPTAPLQDVIQQVKFSYFRQGRERSEALLAETLEPITDPGGKTITVFNTLSWSRTGLVTLPEGMTAVKHTPTQTLATGETVFLARDVPALGARSFELGSSDAETRSDLKVARYTLENALVKVRIDPETGDIVGLVRGGVEYAGGPLNSYHYLKGDGVPETATGPTDVKVSIKEDGPVVVSLLVESRAEGCHWLRREIRLTAGLPTVEIINTLDKIAVTAKEGVHFGFNFNIPRPRSRMDIPWGVVEVDADFFPEANRNWVCFQRWLDISNHERGVVWCSPDAPLFQHGNITANIMGGGGLGSPPWIRGLEPSATVYSWALNNHWFTNFPLSQEGVLTFRYGILPRDTPYDAAVANRFGMEQARPLIAVRTAKAIDVTPPVSIDNCRVVVSSLKSEPEGLVVTLRSLSERPETVTITRSGALEESTIDMLPQGVDSATFK